MSKSVHFVKFIFAIVFVSLFFARERRPSASICIAHIIPIIFRSSKNVSDKKFRVSVKDLPENIDIHNQGDIQLYLNNLLNSKSYLDRVDKSLEDIFEYFNYNVKLVELSELNYPEYILDIFDKYSEYTICNDISIAENQIRANSNKLKDVLDFI